MASSSPPQIVNYNNSIILTEKERLIFELLIKVVKHYDLKTELRVAGGWVRDKLLGMESDDIDIALYEMSGSEFCKKITEYLSCTGDTTVASVITHNSKKSEHLETAKMKLDGIWIDFVNLRFEVYFENSRIPDTRFASATDDALRRDITINSLFYNIIDRSVEDFTRRGIDDLSNGRISTSLPPQVSFLQDPLRVFRAIRFAARFGFTLDEELKTAAKSAEVKAAIAIKLNPELIGREVDLMISGKDPVKALTYLCDLSLFSVVFSIPPKIELASLQGFERLFIANMDAVANTLKLVDRDPFNEGDRRLVLYAAMLLPLRKFTYKDKKSKEIPLVDYIFRDSLKLEMDDPKKVIMIHKAAERFASLIPYFKSEREMDASEVLWEKEQIDVPLSYKLRVNAGLLMDEIKGLWRISLLISTLLYPDTLDLSEYTSGKIDMNKKKMVFTEVENKITKLGLEEVALGLLKPLVDGKAIMNALRLKSASSVVGEWQRKIRQWQLVHPQATKEQCLSWIKETHSKRLKTDNEWMASNAELPHSHLLNL